MIRFIFDLDGTVSTEETLPVIAAHFHIEEEMGRLTAETVAGNIPFTDSFIKRVHMLSRLPVSEINTLLGQVGLFSDISAFIAAHREHCVIATGNLDCWVEKLLSRINVESHTSSARVEDDHIAKITNILQKEDVVKMYKAPGRQGCLHRGRQQRHGSHAPCGYFHCIRSCPSPGDQCTQHHGLSCL